MGLKIDGVLFPDNCVILRLSEVLGDRSRQRGNFMAYGVAGLALWLVFFLVVPPGERRACYPTLVFTALLATIADLLGVVYNQWEYIGPTIGGLSIWSDLGIAPPQGGLAVYLQRKYPAWTRVNWLFWIGANAVGERLFVQWGLIQYHMWTSLKATLFYFLFFAVIYVQNRLLTEKPERKDRQGMI